jgi:hypothetical protein
LFESATVGLDFLVGQITGAATLLSKRCAKSLLAQATLQVSGVWGEGGSTAVNEVKEESLSVNVNVNVDAVPALWAKAKVTAQDKEAAARRKLTSEATARAPSPCRRYQQRA